jgi:hypothetical protein
VSPLGRRGRAALACLGATVLQLALQACYSSVAAPLTGPAPSGDVTLVLSPEGSARLVSALGPRAASLDGRVVSRTDSSLTVVVTGVARTTGTREDWPADQVVVPVSAVQTLSVRRLSVGRSVAFAAVGAVAAFLIGRGFTGTQGGGTTKGGGSEQGK